MLEIGKHFLYPIDPYDTKNHLRVPLVSEVLHSSGLLTHVMGVGSDCLTFTSRLQFRIVFVAFVFNQLHHIRPT